MKLTLKTSAFLFALILLFIGFTQQSFASTPGGTDLNVCGDSRPRDGYANWDEHALYEELNLWDCRALTKDVGYTAKAGDRVEIYKCYFDSELGDYFACMSRAVIYENVYHNIYFADVFTDKCAHYQLDVIRDGKLNDLLVWRGNDFGSSRCHNNATPTPPPATPTLPPRPNYCQEAVLVNPYQNSTVTALGGSTYRISGYAQDPDGISRIPVFVDGVFQADAVLTNTTSTYTNFYYDYVLPDQNRTIEVSIRAFDGKNTNSANCNKEGNIRIQRAQVQNNHPECRNLNTDRTIFRTGENITLSTEYVNQTNSSVRFEYYYTYSQNFNNLTKGGSNPNDSWVRFGSAVDATNFDTSGVQASNVSFHVDVIANSSGLGATGDPVGTRGNSNFVHAPSCNITVQRDHTHYPTPQCNRVCEDPNNCPFYNPYTQQTFPDVPSSSPYFESIHNLECHNVVHGFSNGYFKPQNFITRAEMAKIIENAYRFPENTNCREFNDVGRDSKFYNEVMTLRCNNVISGYSNNTFRPDNFLTREEASKFLINGARIAMADFDFMFTSNRSGFTDVSSNNVFRDYIYSIRNQGIYDPVIPTSQFRPNDLITREQMSYYADEIRKEMVEEGWGV